MRRHGQYAPHPAAAVPHLGLEPNWRCCVAPVLGSDLLKRGTHDLPINGVAPHASVLARDVHGIGRRNRGYSRNGYNRRIRGERAPANPRHDHDYRKPLPHFTTGAVLPGCTSELLTGAGACTSSGVALTDEFGTAPMVASLLIGVTAGVLAPDAAAAVNAWASSGLMYWNTFTTWSTPGTVAATSAPCVPSSRVTRPIRYTVSRSHTTL